MLKKETFRFKLKRCVYNFDFEEHDYRTLFTENEKCCSNIQFEAVKIDYPSMKYIYIFR